MTEFLRLLALYYTCDSTAALRPMTASEVANCMAHYETVKSYFAEPGQSAPVGSPERVARNRAAFAGFKAWEAENAETVKSLRDAARQLAKRS